MLLITENHVQMFHRRIDLWPGNKLNFIVIVPIVLQHRLHDVSKHLHFSVDFITR